MEITGKVIHGENIGSKQGYPTANLHPRVLKNKKISKGVYLVDTNLKKKQYDSLLVIGVPGERIQKKGKVEVFFLNQVGNIYGQRIKIRVLKKLRNLIFYSDQKKLLKQIKQDISRANKFFK